MASGPAVLICLPIIKAILVLTGASLVEAVQVGDPGAWLLAALFALLTFLFVLDLSSLAVYVPMLAFTKGLREGRPHWHWVAFAEAVVPRQDDPAARMSPFTLHRTPPPVVRGPRSHDNRSGCRPRHPAVSQQMARRTSGRGW